jgi:D-3-phosphoglycerate dehydrogenase
MKVLFYDTETKLPLGNASSARNLKELVANSDVISLHVPETSQTKNLITKALLKSFKKGSILINYARGEVVDLKALAVALDRKDISVVLPLMYIHGSPRKTAISLKRLYRDYPM